KRPVKLPVLYRKALHVRGLVEPREKHLADHAAVFAVDVKAFFKVAAHGNGQIEVAQTAVGEIDAHKPAGGAEPLQQTGLDRLDLAPEKASAVEQVTAVRQHEIAALVRLRIPLRSQGSFADLWNRLQIVGHRVAVRGIVVPGFESHALADFVLQKLLREGNAR